jgi:3D (Asp-Asp-Asp) domain-containing protein
MEFVDYKKRLTISHWVDIFFILFFGIATGYLVTNNYLLRKTNKTQAQIIEAQKQTIIVQTETIDKLSGTPTQDVIVTSYYPKNPKTASGVKPRPGHVAVSRDLFKQGWTFGKRVYIPQMGIYKIEDLTHRRLNKRVDVALFDNNVSPLFTQEEVTLLE